MKFKISYSSLVLTFGLLLSLSCNPQISQSTILTNTPAAQDNPYLILISLDGFRWDYVERFKPPALSAFIKNGVQAEALIPSFPSKTFPNHYTIATGMYPDHHGIIGNSFFSYKNQQLYKVGNRTVVEDGKFYGGDPIWVLANRAGMVTASYFFVGTEADVQGIRPTYYYRYDGSVKNETRVQQAIDWLALPAEKRPHLITMYFSDMDDTGHRYGPNNDKELSKSLLELDQHLGTLFQGIKDSRLPINVVIVSDHGMKEVANDQYLPIGQIKNDELYTTIDNGAIASIHPKDLNQTEAIYQSLKAKEKHFSVYKTKEAAQFEYVPENPDWGAIQVIPDDGYYFANQTSISLRMRSTQKVSGQHGFDPKLKDMHGIFYANGPAFQKGEKLPALKNIHVYPLLCEVLGLNLPKDIDGSLKMTNRILKK